MDKLDRCPVCRSRKAGVRMNGRTGKTCGNEDCKLHLSVIEWEAVPEQLPKGEAPPRPLDPTMAHFKTPEEAIEAALHDIVLEEFPAEQNRRLSKNSAASVVIYLRVSGWNLTAAHPKAQEGEAGARATELAQELDDWRNREAACCPEDVGFEEVIKALRAKVESLEAANSRMAEGIQRWVQAFGALVPEEAKARMDAKLQAGAAVPAREALEVAAQYMGHDIDCTYSEDSYNDGPWPCSCGMDKALAALLGAGGEG